VYKQWIEIVGGNHEIVNLLFWFLRKSEAAIFPGHDTTNNCFVISRHFSYRCTLYRTAAAIAHNAGNRPNDLDLFDHY